ncbi:MAG: DUF2341 domain-containing protein [Gammaproteobacteria bacterium]|nr:DUF2341 domain-containing protein [Gammaproteobacteria bacterium]
MKLRYILPLSLFLVLTLTISCFPQSVNAQDSWLENWNYRKQHFIAYASGAGTDYQVKIRTYFESVAVGNFSFVSRTGADKGANQGVASDGSYYYTAGAAPAGADPYEYIQKFNASDWSQVASHNCTLDEPTDKTQVNNIYHKDGYLYLGANNYNIYPIEGWIVVYDASDLSFVEYHSVGERECEGCAYYGGYWWVIAGNVEYITQYDTSWNEIATYTLSYCPHQGTARYCTGYQGVMWIDNFLYVNIHDSSAEDFLDCYQWTGSGFTAVKRMVRPSINCGQGLSLDPDGETVWWAERSYGVDDHRVIKTTIDTSGYAVSLEQHCRTDFGDVRFVDDDGITLLSYWMEEKQDGVYADFWVEIHDSLSYTNQSIYAYYGNPTATTTSYGFNTFLFFDDFNRANNPIVGLGWSEFDELGGTNSISNYMLKQNDISITENVEIEHYYNYTSNHAYVFKVRTTDCTPDIYMMTTLNQYKTDHVTFYKIETDLLQFFNGTAYTTIQTVEDNTWYKIETYLDNANDEYTIWVDDVEQVSDESYINAGYPEYLSYTTATNDQNWQTYYDNVYVRKRVDPEPVHGTWGAEQIYTEPPIVGPDVNLVELPVQLAEHWGISSFAAGIFMSGLLSFGFLLALLLIPKKPSILATMIVGFCVLGFCIAIGWLPYWIMLLISLLIAAIYASTIKKMM